MKRSNAAIIACAVLLCFGPNVHAQGSISGSGTIVAVAPSGPPAVVGEPYSATFETEMSQTLADGTHIERHTITQKQFRDSQDRTRTEEYLVDPAIRNADPNTPSSISIRDPGTGITWLLNPPDHTARQMMPPKRPDPAAISQMAQAQKRAESLRPRVEQEDLGAQTIEGLFAKGTRMTTTVPTGAQGNDRPIVIVQEGWVSPDLKLMVLSKRFDPRNGEQTIRLTNIDRSEPDPSLFEVPADYTVVQPQR